MVELRRRGGGADLIVNTLSRLQTPAATASSDPRGRRWLARVALASRRSPARAPPSSGDPRRGTSRPSRSRAGAPCGHSPRSQEPLRCRRREHLSVVAGVEAIGLSTKARAGCAAAGSRPGAPGQFFHARGPWPVAAARVLAHCLAPARRARPSRRPGGAGRSRASRALGAGEPDRASSDRSGNGFRLDVRPAVARRRWDRDRAAARTSREALERPPAILGFRTAAARRGSGPSCLETPRSWSTPCS